MTDESFLQARGLKPVKPKSHAGPINAKRLVEGYGCYVFPLARGSKVPTAETRGVLDAVADASAIISNYGIACGASGILAVDLDDYVPDNEIQAFLDTFELPPTFTIRTGSGGRSMWFRVPNDFDFNQNLGGLARGVDFKAGNTYILGPGNQLHPSNIKKDSGGDGQYMFIKGSPTEFAPAPQRLLDALLERKAEHVEITTDHSAYDELSDELKPRVQEYVRKALELNLDRLDALKNLDEGERNPEGHGWETGTLAYTGAIAQLVKANWTGLDYDEVLELVKKAVPYGGNKDLFAHHVGLFVRAVSKDEASYPPRQFPPALLEPEFDWWPKDARRQGFPEAGGSDEAPPAEPIHIDQDPDDWPREPWNEEGHVARTQRWAAGSMRWLTDEGIWVRYNGVHWERDAQAGAKAARKAMQVARWTEQENYDDTPKVDEKTGEVKPDSSERAKFVKRLSDDSTDRMFNSVARVLSREEGIEADSSDFDREEMLLGVANGTVDLRTGELLPGTPEQMISMASPVAYDPAATAPRFHEYLAESIPSADVRHYLQRVVGYSITGSTIEQVMFFHYGEATNNGKSVLIYLIEQMLGEGYSGVGDPKALIESKNDQHATHIAGLAGPRVLMMSETARGARLSDVLIKQITGEDKVRARKMRQDNQNYRIIGKIHMATNHLPHIIASKSTNRRIHVIPWPVEIDNDKIDLRLKYKLAESELAGILNWAIEGAKAWWAELEASQGRKDGERPSGLGIPVEVRQATDKYLGDEDQIGQWMDDRCRIGNEEFETASNLYRDYKWWVEARGERPMTQTGFSLDLKKHDIEYRRSNSARGFVLGLKPMQNVGTGGYFQS